MRIVAPLLLLGLLAGCSFLQPDDAADLPPSTLPVTFSAAPEGVTFAIGVEDGAVVVQDQTITGICHRREERGAYLEGDVVTLWFAHTGDQRDICPSLGKVGAYRASISGLAPGTYQVRVAYIGHISTNTYPHPALEQEVTVP